MHPSKGNVNNILIYIYRHNRSLLYMVFPKITFPTRSGSTVTALEAIAERESIYRVLAQTTPENTSKDYASYTCDPHTRYPTLNTKV